jgi:type I restriction enzyme R subunit
VSNFAFLPQEFREIAEAAKKAEGYVLPDPRSAGFHARFALEAAVKWLYRFDNRLRTPYDNSLNALLHEPSFQNAVPEAIFQKAKLIQKIGNHAVHEKRAIEQAEALQAAKELHHICYWLTHTYTPAAPRDGAAWKDERIPKPAGVEDVVPRKALEALEKQLAEQKQAEFKRQQERDALDAELKAARAQIATYRTAAEKRPDPHDYTEAETRKYLIDVDLKRAGWPLNQTRDREYEVKGMPNNQGIGYADYVLWGDDGKPLGVVEAKKTTADPTKGQQQAKLYADCLEAMHGQRPVIFYTNGYVTWIWDDTFYPPRRVAGFYKKAELESLIRRRDQRQALDVANVKDDIVERYYQKRAIGSIATQFAKARRKALLVMATGTGKTRTAIALVDLLQRAGWVKRALFLADRVSLVNQAANAFKKHLPDSSPVNLVTEKEKDGRVYVSTYPTMMGLIDETHGGEARFSPGHFDLIIIDEAHRSVYQKFGSIFRYFDSLLVGLTATPREQVDKNTYDLFELEPGVPTDAYELDTAVVDEFLVRPKVRQVDLKFPREGIDYDSLSEEEKEQWEGLDWGDQPEDGRYPTKVNAAAINSWLFNEDTVDKVLQYLMEHGHKVDGGDRLAKTIIFARNHDHAKYIEERFNAHYAHYAGHFARVIDHEVKYPQSLIDDFSKKDAMPHIAISVDMLDTGIDVPEVANLVFFKPVYSKIKFWQMIGRGTRLCPDLFGPGLDKTDFRIFDFCFNFDFFRENPAGIEAGSTASLGMRIFQSRVRLMKHLQDTPDLDDGGKVHQAVRDRLYQEVATMNRDNFIVRMHLDTVERFQNKEIWGHLSDGDCETLVKVVAGLPSQLPSEEIESRHFDLTALQMQMAVIEGNAKGFESLRKKVVEMAGLLEEKTGIPAVQRQLGYLQRLQEVEFWEGITVAMLEDMRVRLRELVPFLDKKVRKIVYTDFQDEIVAVYEEDLLDLSKMTSSQYAKKVEEYLRTHLDNIAVQRLRTNRPLTPADLKSLEEVLTKIGDADGPVLLNGLLQRSGAPSLAHFVRSLVGMDRATAQAAFSTFLSDRSLTPPQIRFVEMVIDQLTSRGVITADALYEPPFSNLHAGGPEGLFAGKDNVIEGIFQALEQLAPRVVERAG